MDFSCHLSPANKTSAVRPQLVKAKRKTDQLPDLRRKDLINLFSTKAFANHILLLTY